MHVCGFCGKSFIFVIVVISVRSVKEMNQTRKKCIKENPTTATCRKCPILNDCEDGKFLIELEEKLNA